MEKILNIANIITFFRLFLIVPFLFFGLNGEMIYAAIIFAIIPILDKIDGIVARKLKIQTQFGSFLDSSSDWLSLVVSFILVSYLGLVDFFWTIVILSLSLILIFAKFTSSKRNKKIEASIPGKISVGLSYLTITLILLSVPYTEILLGIVTILGLVTVVNFLR